MSHHLMIDLETLGLSADAAIVSIGAGLFDIRTGDVHSVFHRKVDFTPEMGRVDPATVLCWFEQSEEARRSLLEGKRESLSTVLGDFHEWVTQYGVGKVAGLWSNGPTFDEIILRGAYERLMSRPFPLSFRLSRCCRTFSMLARDYAMPRSPFDGVKHDALDDAMN